LIARRFGRNEPESNGRGDDSPDERRDDADATQFKLEETHERRILSWSPDPDEEFGPESRQPAEETRPLENEVRVQAQPPTQRLVPAALTTPPLSERAIAHEPLRAVAPAVAAPPSEPIRDAIADLAPGEDEDELELPVSPAPLRATGTDQQPRKRGRPRGRPRRQVHFHVDPDEELLLLAAAEAFGSQQKGLVAALQALQDNQILRAEVERLRTECERQRVLLAEAEAIFNR
jgi:hypothetical protein